ncbi:MAG: ComEC/Rec2 family competence protein [Flavobacteriaceae bacterium]|nr:ComEC/Rec2 family competence protein [Flavobacteriaceae bacterium]
MKRVLNYLPIHILVFLILGIILQFYLKIWQLSLLYFFPFFIAGILISLLFKNRIVTTLISFLLFFLIGVFSVYIQNDKNSENYYQNFLKENSLATLRITKVLKPSIYHYKYEAKVIEIDASNTNGKVLLNIQKDSSTTFFDVDDVLLTSASFQEVLSPLNPHQFNYKSYLKRQGINKQLYLNHDNFLYLNKTTSTIKGYAAKVRKVVQKSLKKYHFNDDEFGVISALLLGQRNEISKELIAEYSKAGAIHILAVSGLHVGIILLLLLHFFKPLDNFKNGKYIKVILVITLLWLFACIAGLSASVVRAVTMFSFVAFGQLFKRKNVVEFSLISSMLFLLVFNPMFLFDVGFQLSYLAVFGIIWIQPKLYKFWQPKLKVVDFFWKLITVSIAAQAVILPLSLFYFHQFPGLFLLSNLIIIPFLGTILLLGIVVIYLAVFKILPQVIANFYQWIINLMNSFVSWISNQEAFLFEDISLSFLMMIGCYLVIISCINLITKFSANKLVLVLVSLIIVQSIYLFEHHKINKKNELIVFHKSRASIFGNRIGDSLFINIKNDSLSNQSFLRNYKIGEQVFIFGKSQIVNYFKLKKQQFLVVDSLGIYNINSLKSPVVLLQNSPKINVSRLIQLLKPELIVADGSNYKSYVYLWEKVSKGYNTRFYYTGKEGAFRFKY